MTERKPKACVILGAGASHDGWISGAPAVLPPVTVGLFDDGQPSFVSLLSQYPGARYLANLIVGRPDIEAVLHDLALREDPVTRKQFKEVPAYLRDVIYATTTSASIPGSYVELIDGLLVRRPHDVLFLVLNYDTLLEQALAGRGLLYKALEDYIRPERPAKIIKLHGSVNWFMNIGNATNTWMDLIEDFDIFQKPPDSGMHVVDDVKFVHNGVFGNQRLYPIVTAPLAGKSPSDVRCPDAHTQVTEEFLADCGKVLIIGSSGRDDDLFKLLDTSLGQDINCYVHLVGGSDDAKNSLGRFKRGVRALRASVEPVVASGGFRTYVRSEDFERFLAYGS